VGLRNTAQEEAAESDIRRGGGPSRTSSPLPAFAHHGSGLKPRIRCSAKHKLALGRIIRSAGYVKQPYGSPVAIEDLFRNDARTVAEVAADAVSWLVYYKAFSTPIPELRAMVRSKRAGPLRKAMETLAALLPDAGVPLLWRLLRAQYAGGDPFAIDLRRDGDMAKEDDWDRRLHPAILRETVCQILRLMDELDSKARGTRPPEVPERMFVETLARYWTEDLKLLLKNGRWPTGRTKGKNEPRSQENEQCGPFADFVRKVAELYPEEYLLVAFPKQRHKYLRLASMDGHIRAVADKSARKTS
jgi:hypothetical protein